MIEDSCDALGARLRGTPTGTRSDISVTSFALAHIITAAATGGMVLLDDDELIDRCLLLRRWGRRSEPQFFGTKKGDREFFTEVDGIEYDNLFIFDEVGWNFEPCEISAAFGNVQLKKLPINLARRQRNFDILSAFFGTYPDVFSLPRQLAGLETGWHMFPIMLRPESGIRRGEFQQYMEGHGIDTRMVWTGNVTRQPAFAEVPHRAPAAGLPNADRVMEQGLILPLNHGLDDDDIEYLCVTAGRVPAGARVRPCGGAGVSGSGRFAGRRAVVTGASRGIGAGHRPTAGGRGRGGGDRRPHARRTPDVAREPHRDRRADAPATEAPSRWSPPTSPTATTAPASCPRRPSSSAARSTSS